MVFGYRIWTAGGLGIMYVYIWAMGHDNGFGCVHEIGIRGWFALHTSNSGERTACFLTTTMGPLCSRRFVAPASRYLKRVPIAIQRLAALFSILWNRPVTLLLNALSQCSHMKKSDGASSTTFCGTFRHLLCLPRSQMSFWCLV